MSGPCSAYDIKNLWYSWLTFYLNFFFIAFDEWVVFIYRKINLSSFSRKSLPNTQVSCFFKKNDAPLKKKKRKISQDRSQLKL